MAKIVLISCVKEKLPYKAKAKELYDSAYFKYNLKYAKILNPDSIFILSAKYGLLNLETEIEPYNKTLNDMRTEEIKKWANKVIDQLNKVTDLKKDLFIFLGGEKYRKCLIPHIDNYEIPLKGLRIGEQKKWLKEKLRK